MSSSNDYILVTGSRNLDDGSSDSDAKVHEEDEDSSLFALEGEGVSILDEKNSLQTNHALQGHDPDEPRDQLSQELLDQGGIEIIQGDEESFL